MRQVLQSCNASHAMAVSVPWFLSIKKTKLYLCQENPKTSLGDKKHDTGSINEGRIERNNISSERKCVIIFLGLQEKKITEN